jgi:hypothetical protein
MGDARKGIAHFAFWIHLRDIFQTQAAKISIAVS